jgi:hypothetical protein
LIIGRQEFDEQPDPSNGVVGAPESWVGSVDRKRLGARLMRAVTGKQLGDQSHRLGLGLESIKLRRRKNGRCFGEDAVPINRRRGTRQRRKCTINLEPFRLPSRLNFGAAVRV